MACRDQTQDLSSKYQTTTASSSKTQQNYFATEGQSFGFGMAFVVLSYQEIRNVSAKNKMKLTRFDDNEDMFVLTEMENSLRTQTMAKPSSS
ncbi:hypothetical protein SLE2022_205610 [Rubroshorea leprosula]